MPLNLFCNKCGCVNEYTLSKPKFCQQCGNSFSLTAPAPVIANKTNIIAQTPVVKNEKQYDTDEDGRYEVITNVPKIDNLQVIIEVPKKNKFTLGDLRPDLKEEMSKLKAEKITKRPVGRPKTSNKNKK